MTNSSYVLWRHSYSSDSNQPPTCVSKTGFKAVKTHRHGRQTGMMSCNQIRSVFHLKTANIFAVLSVSQVFISEHVPMKYLLQSFEMVSIQNSKKKWTTVCDPAPRAGTLRCRWNMQVFILNTICIQPSQTFRSLTEWLPEKLKL